MNKRITLLLSLLFLLLFTVSPLAAQTPCTIVYGGGVQENDQPYCMETVGAASPTPSQTNARDIDTSPQNPSAGSGQAPSGSGQTKGGLPVQPAPTTPTQPATGPESAALLAILPAGALGYYLRRKTVS